MAQKTRTHKKTSIYLARVGVALALLMVAIFYTATTQAQSGGLTVSPALLEISLTNEYPIQESVVAVTNNFDVAVNITSEITSVDDQSGTLAPTEEPNPTLSQISTITPSATRIEAGKSINIKLKITDSPSLSPGGHYGALLIKQVSASKNQVRLQSGISVVLFVTKEQGAVRSLSMTTPDSPRVRFVIPKSINLLFKNTGNTLITPRASVTIDDTSQPPTTFAKGSINDKSIPLFPDKTANLEVPLQTTNRIWWPGKYQQIVQYRYDGTDEQQTQVQNIWYVPLYWVVILVASICIVLIYILKHRKTNKPKHQKTEKNRS